MNDRASRMYAVVALIVLLHLRSLAEASTFHWSQAEPIATFDSKLRSDSFNVVVLESGPAFVFSREKPGDVHYSLEIAERKAASWEVTTVVDLPPRQIPITVASASLDGALSVAVKLDLLQNNKEFRVFSRRNGVWQQEFRDPNLYGSAFAEHIEATVVGNRVITAFAEGSPGSYITALERSGTNGAWSSNRRVFSFEETITHISTAGIDNAPAFLMTHTRLDYNYRTYLALMRDGEWHVMPGTPRIDARLAEWQGRPAIVAKAGRYPEDLIIFDYLDDHDMWHSEIIVGDHGNWTPDVLIFKGQPMVAYFDYEGADAGLHIATRNENGLWLNELIAPGQSPSQFKSIQLFEWNGRPGIAYMDESRSSIHLVLAVPEPSAVALLAGAVMLSAGIRRRD